VGAGLDETKRTDRSGRKDLDQHEHSRAGVDEGPIEPRSCRKIDRGAKGHADRECEAVKAQKAALTQQAGPNGEGRCVYYEGDDGLDSHVCAYATLGLAVKCFDPN
jgi:hypothetical protein